jgi:hypothetical protein
MCADPGIFDMLLNNIPNCLQSQVYLFIGKKVMSHLPWVQIIVSFTDYFLLCNKLVSELINTLIRICHRGGYEEDVSLEGLK